MEGRGKLKNFIPIHKIYDHFAILLLMLPLYVQKAFMLDLLYFTYFFGITVGCTLLFTMRLMKK